MGVIITGTTLKRRVVGAVRDFCPICREGKECDLVRVGAAWHLYWISFTQGTFAGYEARCPDCGVRWSAQKEDPGREARIVEREARERRRAAGGLSETERAALLEEPFLVLEPMVKEQQKHRRLNRTGTIAGIVTLGLGAVFLWGFRGGWGDEAPDPVAGVLGVVWIGALFVTAWFVLGPMSWYRKEVVEPALVRALRPLEPTREELGAVLRGFRLRGKLVAKIVKAGRLHALLEE